MYDDLVKTIRHCVATMKCTTCPVDSIDKTAKAQQRCVTLMLAQAADAIEGLQAKFAAEHDLRVKALDRLCEWCGVCSVENRNAVGCDDIARLDEVHAPRWISVEEALPEENGRYLVRYKRDIVLDYTECHDDEARVMRFSTDTGWRYPFLCQPELRNAQQQTVTHWMPLPEPPKEET